MPFASPNDRTGRPAARRRTLLVASAALLASIAVAVAQTIQVTVTVTSPTTTSTTTVTLPQPVQATAGPAAPLDDPMTQAQPVQPPPVTRPTTDTAAAGSHTVIIPPPSTQDMGGGSVISVPKELIVDAPQAPTVAATQATEVERVLVVSIDGMRPDCMLRAATPTLRSLMDQGSFTMYARTTDWAITSPSHASMLTGVTPEVHGVTYNSDPPEGAYVHVPTIFDIAKEHGLTTGLASGKSKFSIFTRSGHVDWSWLSTEGAGPDEPVAENAARIVREHKPQLMFVHFPGADVNGHGRGWGTPQQLAALATIDTGLGKVLAAYDEAGIRAGTLIIVSADHGGSGRSHGRDDPRSRYIPWIASGPGVRRNFDLTRLGTGFDVATFDTFATVCDALKLPIPELNEGNPVLPIYERYPMVVPSQFDSRRKPSSGTTTGPATVPTSPRRGTTWPVG